LVCIFFENDKLRFINLGQFLNFRRFFVFAVSNELFTDFLNFYEPHRFFRHFLDFYTPHSFLQATRLFTRHIAFIRIFWTFTGYTGFYEPHGFYAPQLPDAGADVLFSDILRRVKCQRTYYFALPIK